jgi:tetratricopeptide (TPR) repeat protein
MTTTTSIPEKTKRTPVPINGVDTPKLVATINAVGSHPDFAQFQIPREEPPALRYAQRRRLAADKDLAEAQKRTMKREVKSRLNGSIAPIKGNLRWRCEHAVRMMLTQRGEPLVEVESVLAEDPDCVFGHCLRAALVVRADNAAQRSTLATSIAAIEAGCPDVQNPARRHAIAARAWLEGNSTLAVALYSGLLVDWPHDVLALAVAHALDFHLGRPSLMRHRIAQVLPKWSVAVPGFPSVLAMYAFALEESGQYRHAEKIARRALALDPEHAGAIHVIAHIMEMQGRAYDGLAFLAKTERAWSEGTGLSVHLAWHRALFYLETNDFKSALAAYDNQIVKANDLDVSALADRSALLWRLQLQEIDVDERWQPLADQWEKQILAETRPFYIVHAIMAVAAAGRTAAALRVIEALHTIDMNTASSANPGDALALPLCEALLAFTRGNYAACVESLVRVRHIARRCGGSLAQCNLVHLTLTEAALRARRDRLARMLVADRTAQKPTSRLNQWLQGRLGMAASEHEPKTRCMTLGIRL